MYYDLLDILRPHANYTCTGSFYKRRPKTAADGGEVFSYRYVNNYSRTWTRLFGNVQAESGEVTIATKELLDVIVTESRVVLQDGKLFSVLSVEENLPETPKQAFRLFGKPLMVEKVMRLKALDNTWGLT